MTDDNRSWKSIQEVKQWISSKTDRHCPALENPFTGCYVNNMNSRTVDDAIYYCGGHFEECEIYMRGG